MREALYNIRDSAEDLGVLCQPISATKQLACVKYQNIPILKIQSVLKQGGVNTE